MSIPSFSLASIKSAADELRAQVYPRNETEKKVYEALSSKNWGASTTLMQDIANETSDYEKFQIVMNLVWASLETEGKSWKQIFKALTLIDFLVKNGSERVIESSRDRLHKIRSLQDYNYYEQSVDKGSGVREKAKQLVELLGSNEMIRSEREKARALRSKFVGISNDGGSGGFGGGGSRRDSYSSNSRGFGSDSYDNGGRYDGGGGGRYDNGSRFGDADSYSSKGAGSSGSRDNDFSSGSRFGGGAYDSGRPPKFSDDGPTEPKSSFGDDDDTSESFSSSSKPASKSKSSSSSASKAKPLSAPTSDTGKLKVSIKKVGTSSTTAPASAAAPEIDFFGTESADPFQSSTPAPAAAPVQSFDPFGMSAPAAPVAQAAPAVSSFDPFAPAPVTIQGAGGFGGAFPPAAPQAQGFDPFGGSNIAFQSAPSVPVQPVAQQFNGFAGAAPAGFGGAPVSYQQPMGMQAPAAPTPQLFLQTQQPQQPQGSAMAFTGAGSIPSPKAVPAMGGSNQYYANQSSRGQASTSDAEFGDFEGVGGSSSLSATSASSGASKWGDLGKLVDLSGISKNEAPAAKQQAQAAANPSYTQNSFAGLDGFQKSNPANNSMRGGAPMMASMGQAGAPMRQAQPMMGQPMGGMPMGGAPMMGGPSPGYGQPTGMPGGFGNAGYGAPMGAPMGNSMGGAPMGMGMGMGMAPTGYGQQMGGSVMGGYNPQANAGFGQQQQYPPRGW